MKNSLRKACILVALDMLDDTKPKKRQKKVRSMVAATAAEEAIQAIFEASQNCSFDSDMVDCAGRIYKIAIGHSDSDIRLAAIRAIKAIAKDCCFSSSSRTCISYVEALAK